MFTRFYPDYKFKTVDDIPDGFFAQNNIKFALLDIDNTLVAYTSPLPDERALRFLERLKRLGVGYCFVSNNHAERVEQFCAELDIFRIADAHKPLLGAVKKAMRHMGAEKNNTVLIGDQVFTDVYSANRAGLLSVMVDPIEAKETPFFGFKRVMERIVLKNYKGSEYNAAD